MSITSMNSTPSLGNKFKTGFAGGASVQHGDSFVIVGGATLYHNWYDAIHLYDPESDSFQLLGTKLSEKKTGVVSFKVKMSAFPSCF